MSTTSSQLAAEIALSSVVASSRTDPPAPTYMAWHRRVLVFIFWHQSLTQSHLSVAQTMPLPKVNIATTFPLYVYEVRSSEARESECPPRKYETLESTHNTIKHANAALKQEAEDLSSRTELNKWIKDQDEDGLYYWYPRDRGSKYRHFHHLGIRRRKAKEDELACLSAEVLEQIRHDSTKQHRRAELRADPAFVRRVEQEIF